MRYTGLKRKREPIYLVECEPSPQKRKIERDPHGSHIRRIENTTFLGKCCGFIHILSFTEKKYQNQNLGVIKTKYGEEVLFEGLKFKRKDGIKFPEKRYRFVITEEYFSHFPVDVQERVLNGEYILFCNEVSVQSLKDPPNERRSDNIQRLKRESLWGTRNFSMYMDKRKSFGQFVERKDGNVHIFGHFNPIEERIRGRSKRNGYLRCFMKILNKNNPKDILSEFVLNVKKNPQQKGKEKAEVNAYTIPCHYYYDHHKKNTAIIQKEQQLEEGGEEVPFLMQGLNKEQEKEPSPQLKGILVLEDKENEFERKLFLEEEEFSLEEEHYDDECEGLLSCLGEDENEILFFFDDHDDVDAFGEDQGTLIF